MLKKSRQRIKCRLGSLRTVESDKSLLQKGGRHIRLIWSTVLGRKLVAELRTPLMELGGAHEQIEW